MIHGPKRKKTKKKQKQKQNNNKTGRKKNFPGVAKKKWMTMIMTMT